MKYCIDVTNPMQNGTQHLADLTITRTCKNIGTHRPLDSHLLTLSQPDAVDRAFSTHMLDPAMPSVLRRGSLGC